MLSRKEFDDYVSKLEGLSKGARETMWKYWQAIDFNEVGAAINTTRDLMYALSSEYGDAAAKVAADFYEAIRAKELGGAYEALLADNAPYDQIRKQVGYAAKNHLLGETPTTEEMYKYLAGCLDKNVKGSARNTITKNALRDKADVRYARVPTGSKTCAFCVMLASRGFVYATEESAGALGQYHAHCDCQIVMNFEKSPKVEGYDPDKYYELYKEGKGVDDTKSRKIEVHDGIKYEAGAYGEVYEKEKRGYAALHDNGYDFTVLSRSDIPGEKTPDMLMNGEYWDLKTPTGGSKSTIDNNVREANKQKAFPVIDNRMSKLSDDEALSSFGQKLELRKIKKGLFITQDGKVIEVKK
ncbi:MAG: hypothetical protein LBQ21_07495 [Clostridiales Family XIII bacterium]|jgi:hypothetical protein|nr:hypothetical protein [Clostridiales Family XIII bacterium]